MKYNDGKRNSPLIGTNLQRSEHSKTIVVVFCTFSRLEKPITSFSKSVCSFNDQTKSAFRLNSWGETSFYFCQIDVKTQTNPTFGKVMVYGMLILVFKDSVTTAMERPTVVNSESIALRQLWTFLYRTKILLSKFLIFVLMKYIYRFNSDRPMSLDLFVFGRRLRLSRTGK